MYMLCTAALICSGEAPSAMALPIDLLILALPSTPGRRPNSGIRALHSGSTSRPTWWLIRRTISLVCSISGAWSSPTGTTCALKAVMSAACEAG
ncbi:hypothetical protein D3C72_1562490 [compost metagenome]